MCGMTFVMTITTRMPGHRVADNDPAWAGLPSYMAACRCLISRHLLVRFFLGIEQFAVNQNNDTIG